MYTHIENFEKQHFDKFMFTIFEYKSNRNLYKIYEMVLHLNRIVSSILYLCWFFDITRKIYFIHTIT